MISEPEVKNRYSTPPSPIAATSASLVSSACTSVHAPGVIVVAIRRPPLLWPVFLHRHTPAACRSRVTRPPLAHSIAGRVARGMRAAGRGWYGAGLAVDHHAGAAAQMGLGVGGEPGH